MIPEGIDMDHYDPLPSWGLKSRIFLVVLAVSLFTGACALENRATARAQEKEEKPVLSGEAVPDSLQSVYPSYARYVEQAIQFNSTDEFNAWRKENPNLDIIGRYVSYGESAALVGATFTTASGHVNRQTYIITIFYNEQVVTEE